MSFRMPPFRRTLVAALFVTFILPVQVFAAFTQDLGYGATGSAVTLVQDFLHEQGLLAGASTGNYLTQTESAVKTFQQKEGIAPASGYWGPLTRAKANALQSTTGGEVRGASTEFLVAAYNFDEGSGSALTDRSGKGNNGTISAGPAWTGSGKTGSALTFNGTNGYVTVPDSATLDLSSAMTLEAWVYPTTAGGWRTVLLKERAGNLSYSLYGSNDASSPSSYVGSTHADGSTSIPVNTWSHLAATYDGTTLRLFVNGTQVSSVTSAAIAVSSDALRIGGNSVWGEFFAGRIDDVRVYNVALSQADITEDMNTPVPNSPLPPLPADTTSPTIPTGLTATAISSSQINLSWAASTDNVGVTGYRVERCQGASCTTFALIGTPSTNSYADTGLTASTQYSYRVRATDAAGNLSGYSATVSGTTQGGGGGAENIYISQTGTGTGASCSSPRSAPWFNTASNWTSTQSVDGKIGPGDTVYLCGTITSDLTFQGGGTSSSYITVDGSGATMSGGFAESDRSWWKVQNVTFSSGITNILMDVDGGSNGVFTGNFADNFAGDPAVWLNQGNTLPNNITISNNFLRQTTADLGNTQHDLIKTEGSTNIVIEGNHLEVRSGGAGANAHNDAIQTFESGSTASLGGPSNWTIRYNRIVMNSAATNDRSWTMIQALGGDNYIYGNVFLGLQGAESANGLSLGGPGNFYIQNNSFIAKAGSNNTIGMGQGTYYLRNNIIYTNGQTALYDSSSANVVTRDHNLWYGPASPSCVTTEICGQDPNFTNYANNDFSLQSTSPANNAGANLGAPYNNSIAPTATWPNPTLVMRPSSGSWDMGAYEVGTPPPPSDTTAPTTPTGLTATVVSSSAINLSWTASTDAVGVTGYRIERCQGVGCSSFTQVGTPTTNSYSDTGLSASTAYSYRVRATDAAGNLSGYSGTAGATTQSGTTPPSGISVSSSSPTFAGTIGSARPAPITMTVTTSNNASWSSADTCSFFDANPTSGSSGGSHTLTPSSGWDALAVGTYQCPITYSASGLTNLVVQVTAVKRAVSSPDTTAPTVSLTAPSNGATVSGASVVVSATASDNVGVAGVQFKLDGANLGIEDTTSPYSITWNTTTATNGSHTLTATARDAAGNQTTSSSVTVTVSNTTTPPPSTKFTIGDRAQVSSGPLNVRATANTTGTLLGTQATNALGTVIGGPTAQGGYNWWQVDYDTAPDGWSAEDYLTLATTPPPSGTNIAPSGTAYRWSKNATALLDTNKIAATGLNDNNTTVDVHLNGGSPETSAMYEAGGVIWATNQTVSSVSFVQGAWESSLDGSFSTNLTLQFTTNGTTWTNSGWSVAPAYSYNSASVTGQTYTFTGTPTSVRGVRISGQVRDVTNSSYWENMREVMAYSSGGTPPPADTTAPTTPTGLTATVNSASQITLNWTASTDAVGVTGYRVERCKGASCSTFAQIGTPTATTYSDTGLTASTQYSYRVRATDAAGNLSGYSSTANATTQAGGSTAGCTTTLSPGANVATAISSAAGGATICLNAGSYGSVTIDNIVKSSMVTVRSASGRTATVDLDLSRSQNITFDNLTISGLYIHNQAKNLQVTNNTFTGQLLFNMGVNGGSSYGNANILVDGNTFDGISVCAQCYEGRVQILSDQTSGVTLSNNHFGNAGESDGIQDASVGTIIGPGNVFDGIIQGNYGRHVDAIQIYGGTGEVIQGNYFRNNSVSLGFYDGGGNVTVRNNVFVGGDRETQIGGYNGFLMEHNTFRDDHLELGTKSANSPNTNWTIQNNIFDNAAVQRTGDQQDGCGSNCVIKYNLLSRGGTIYTSQTNGVTGNAVYAGGGTAVPSTWAGYQLTASSPGYHAASDGLDMGTTYYGSGTVTPPPTDTTAPTTPTGLTATAVSSSAINLSWTASTDAVGVTGYRVERCQGASCTTFAQIGTPTTNSYTDTGLTASTQYSYRVRATDAAGNLSGYSSTANATTQGASGGTIPLSFNDPLFNGLTTTGNTVTIADGGFLSDMSIVETSGNSTITCFGACTINRVRVDSREAVRVGGDGTVNISNSYLEATGTADDHADVIQAYAPGSRGTINVTNTSIVAHNTAATAGIFIADNWTGTINLTDVVINGGPYGIRIYPDTGGDNTISFKNVYFVGPFGYGTMILDADYGGHTNNIIKWENVRNATIVNGVLVPGTLIPCPKTNCGTTPPPSDTTAPTVSFTAPTGGSTVTGSISVSATASDNVGVAGVQFKLDGANLGTEDTTSPYSITWDTTTATNGSHTLTATARDAAGNQTTSTGVVVTVNNMAPDTTAPTLSAISASSITQSGAMISWTTDESADTQVEYGLTTSYGQSTTLNTSLVTSHSQSLSGLSAGATYHYRVKSKDAAGNLAVSLDQTFTTTPAPDTQAPNAVSGMTAGSLTQTSAVLTFTAPSDLPGGGAVASYDIRFMVGTISTANWASATQATGEPAPATPGTSQSYTLAGLTPGMTYTVALRSTDAAGNLSGLSNVVMITTATPPPPADTTAPVISAITTGGITTTGATISWTTNENSDTQVEYGLTTGYGQSTTLATSMATSHSRSLTGLTPGTTYHYRVKSKDAAGNLAQSGDQTFTTLMNPDTTNPTTPAGLAGTANSATQATLSWNPSSDPLVSGQITSGIAGYRVYRCTGSSCTATTQVGSTTDTSFTNSGLTASTVYRWRVRAVDQVGRLSAYSSAVTLTMPAVTVVDTTAPTLSGISALGSLSTTTISWTTNEPADGLVRYGTNAGALSSSVTNTALLTAHTLTLPTLLRRTTYYYQVTSKDAAENSTSSSIGSFRTPRGKTAPITNLQAANGSVILTWTRPDDLYLSSVRVYRSTSGYPTDTTGGALEATMSDLSATSFRDENVTPGTTYYYTLYAVDDEGTLSDPAQISFTPTTPPASTPGNSGGNGNGNGNSGGSGGGGGGGGGGSSASTLPAPASPVALGAPDQVVLQWVNPTSGDFVRARVIRKEGSDPTSVNDGTIVYEGTGQEYADKNVTTGHDYHYAIFALDHSLRPSSLTRVSATPGQKTATEVIKALAERRQDLSTSTPKGIVLALLLTKDLKLGMKDADVTRLQDFLKKLGHFPAAETSSGYFGPLTRKAVILYQQSKNISPVSGFVGPLTRKTLGEGSSGGQSAATPSPSVSSSGALTRTLRRGMEGEDVLLLQQKLQAGGFLPAAITPNGTFGPATETAVRALQCAKLKICTGTPASTGYGLVGAQTRGAL